MMTIPLSITIDNEWDYHGAVPYRIPLLPQGKTVDMTVPYVIVTIAHLHEVLEAHKEKNQKKVNAILSQYFKVT